MSANVLSPATSVVIAHGSGIDDILWFAVPVIVGIAVVRMAERRARARADEQEAGERPDAG